MELKANELRIGNYLNTIHGIKRVSDISVDRYCWFTDNQCEPIPLTKEWLLKFGFEKIIDKKTFCISYYKKSFILLKSSNDDLYFKNLPLKPIKHVHQLQNLFFALTGEELKLIH